MAQNDQLLVHTIKWREAYALAVPRSSWIASLDCIEAALRIPGTQEQAVVVLYRADSSRSFIYYLPRRGFGKILQYLAERSKMLDMVYAAPSDICRRLERNRRGTQTANRREPTSRPNGQKAQYAARGARGLPQTPSRR
ncbi:MAG: hypothetical protein QXP98_08160 [Thermoproteus sp.]